MYGGIAASRHVPAERTVYTTGAVAGAGAGASALTADEFQIHELKSSILDRFHFVLIHFVII